MFKLPVRMYKEAVSYEVFFEVIRIIHKLPIFYLFSYLEKSNVIKARKYIHLIFNM